MNKQERDQIVGFMAAQSSALLDMLDRLSPRTGSDDEPLPGTNPPAVQEFVDRMLGSNQRRTPEQQAAYEAAANAQQGPGTGSIAASSLTDADAVYLMEAQDTAQRQLGDAGKWHNQDVYKALLAGTPKEMAQLRDIRSKKAAQGTVSEYNTDKEGWVKKYAPGSKLEKAFHVWLRAELAKP